jgi:hypothetical protein
MRPVSCYKSLVLLSLVILSSGICISKGIKGQGKEPVGVSFEAGQTAYIVASPKNNVQKKIYERLFDYVSAVLHKRVTVVSVIEKVPANNPAIVLAIGYKESSPTAKIKNSREGFVLETRNIGFHKVVVVNATTELGVKRAIQEIILKSEQRSPGLVIPELHMAESPWVEKREYSLVGWAPEFPRGVFSNPDADKRPDIWLYGDKQIGNYVDMFDAFGFSGIQLMETANSYANLGSVNAYEDRLMKFAKAAKSNNQDVTTWVWAAQFNQYGWVDNDITYTPQPGKTAFTDPKVRAGFERYYNGYVKLAPYTDLLITHFYDPGMLKDPTDVFNYMHLLLNKFRAVNPKVELGVDFWASVSDTAYMKQIVANGFKDAYLLESGMPHLFPPGKRERMHEDAKRQGLKMGIWDWHMSERETDQFPTMHVNAEVISNFYKQIRDGVDKIQHVQYWSEMEAYHLCDIFSMYAEAQLLWNPDKDPDQILQEISSGIWGPVNGPKVLKALKLIQEIRSGSTWDTYWSYKGRTSRYFGSEDPASDRDRAEASLNDFENMKTDTAFVVKFPLPFPPSVFVELIIPHLKQIKAFAEFRIKEKAVRQAAANGVSKDELTQLAVDAWKPVPDYNTWIGTFGQAESRVQETMMRQLAKDIGIKITPPGWMMHRDADRFLQKIQKYQMRSATAVQFKANDAIGKSEFYWPVEKVNECITLLLNVGSIEKVADDTYRLADWEEYCKQ